MVSGRGRKVWPIQKQALIPSCTYAVFLSLRRLQCTSPAQSKLLCFLIGLRAILLIKFDNKLLFVPPDIVGNNLSLHHKGIFTLFSSVRVIAGKKRQECFFLQMNAPLMEICITCEEVQRAPQTHTLRPGALIKTQALRLQGWWWGMDYWKRQP